jgi:nitroreductase
MSETSFEQVVRTRRSVRAYKHEPVPEETLRELVELATLAPTAMNLQPWRFSVTTGREALARANEGVKRACLAAIPRIPDLERFRSAFEDPEFSVFYGAPALVLIQGPIGSQMAAMDCLLAAENLMLAAHAKGLGTCFIGFVLLAREDAELRRMLAVADGHEVVASIIVGFPATPSSAAPERRPAEIAWVR